MQQQPSIGRSVHYTLNAGDASIIAVARLARGGYAHNAAMVGDVYPATIVRVFPTPTTPGAVTAPVVNLQVHLDGTDTHWATSRTEGEGEGHWAWPPRV